MTRACAITENRDISFLYNNKSYANAHDEDSSVTKIIRESVKLLLKYILYSVHIIIKGKKINASLQDAVLGAALYSSI